jgi:hypothetical protein
MPKYQKPGLYINDQTHFPPSIKAHSTSTAIFIGYTERHELDGQSLLNKPVRLSSLQEFESYFGGDATHQFDINLVRRGQSPELTLATEFYVLSQHSPNFLLYRSLCLFFSNGGSDCYVIAVGNYDEVISSTALIKGLAAIKNAAQSSIIAVPDAMALASANYCATVQQTLLSQCSQKANKRFAILDIFQGYTAFNTATQDDCIDVFRHNISGANLSYAAAYYPWLYTTVVNREDLSFDSLSNIASLKKLLSLELEQSYPRRNKKTLTKHNEIQPLIDMIPEAAVTSLKQKQQIEQQKVHQSLLSLSPFFAATMTLIAKKLNVLPPSGAICGAFAIVDSTRGVWKAPANIALSRVNSPCQILSNEQQQKLTIAPSGKSINAIRSFIGKGVLVWVARTMAGNDNEWRYISVRRTATMIEQSICDGLQGLALEVNNQTLWSKAQATIENFLMQLWRAGALAGAKPEEAFFVKVGLNQTMTYTDNQQGRLIIQLGISMTRPAEFTILTIEQKIS